MTFWEIGFQSRVLTILVGIVAILAFIPYLTLQIKGMAYILMF